MRVGNDGGRFGRDFMRLLFDHARVVLGYAELLLVRGYFSIAPELSQLFGEIEVSADNAPDFRLSGDAVVGHLLGHRDFLRKTDVLLRAGKRGRKRGAEKRQCQKYPHLPLEIVTPPSPDSTDIAETPYFEIKPL